MWKSLPLDPPEPSNHDVVSTLTGGGTWVGPPQSGGQSRRADTRFTATTSSSYLRRRPRRSARVRAEARSASAIDHAEYPRRGRADESPDPRAAAPPKASDHCEDSRRD